jgi:hypothetical protein
VSPPLPALIWVLTFIALLLGFCRGQKKVVVESRPTRRPR